MASVRTEALMERHVKNSNSLQTNTPTPPGNHLTLTNKYATKEQHGDDDVKNIKHQALLIIIKDLKMTSLNELFILLSSSLHVSTGWLSPPSSSCFCPHRLLILRQAIGELFGTPLRFLRTHAKLFISNQCDLAIAWYLLHATSAEGTPRIFSEGKL